VKGKGFSEGKKDLVEGKGFSEGKKD